MAFDIPSGSHLWKDQSRHLFWGCPAPNTIVMVPGAHMNWTRALGPFLEVDCSWMLGLCDSFRLQGSLLGGGFRRFGFGQQ